jgi:predicted Fe-S protein YdhL (DUF1289 family)
MARPVSEPSLEEVVRWRKQVEDTRKELFNKPCRKQSARAFSRYVSRDLEEDALRQMLDDSFGLPLAKKELL